MAVTDIDALAEKARASTDAIAAAKPSGRTSWGRPCADLASELSRIATRIPDAVAEAESLIDIGERQFLTGELQDYAALCASALFLGRRLLETNSAEITKLHPHFAVQLGPVEELAAMLGQLSEALLEVFTPPGWFARSVA